MYFFVLQTSSFLPSLPFLYFHNFLRKNSLHMSILHFFSLSLFCTSVMFVVSINSIMSVFQLKLSLLFHFSYSFWLSFLPPPPPLALIRLFHPFPQIFFPIFSSRHHIIFSCCLFLSLSPSPSPPPPPFLPLLPNHNPIPSTLLPSRTSLSLSL